MGDFSYTCAISKLPIEGGDAVRYLLLSASPYVGELQCSPNSAWFPRSFPIKARYNDYGSVQDAEEGIGRDLWHEALKIDLMPVGVGENSCHDVPTSKGMSWEELLNALQERRILVRHNIGDTPADRKKTADTFRQFQKASGSGKKPEPVTPKGVPTLKRVRKALLDARLKVSDGGFRLGLLVSKVRYGTIRLRWSGEGDELKELARAQQALSEYATVVKAGEGSYTHGPELLVFVKAGVDGFRSRKGLPRHKPIEVGHWMVREDVWQALLKLPAPYDYGEKTATIEEHRQAARELYEECRKVYNKALPKGFHGHQLESIRTLRGFQLERLGKGNLVGPWVARDEVPFAVGLATNWRLLVEKNLPVKKVAHVLDSVAELVHVLRILFEIRFAWAPSTSVGPQYGEWDKHALVNTVFAGVAAKIVLAKKRQHEEFEREVAEFQKKAAAKKKRAQKAKERSSLRA